MKKRLNQSELQAVAVMINSRVQKAVNEKAKKILEKNVVFKKAKKLAEELADLEALKLKKTSLLHGLNSSFGESIIAGYNVNVWYDGSKDKVKLNVYKKNNNDYQNIWNELILVNIKDTDIEKAIDSLVEKYSK